MSRIEQALEKAAHLRNTAGARITEKQLEGKPLAPVHGKRPPLPVVPAGEPLPQTDNPFVATLKDPHSPISEEYRKLKSEIVAYAQRDGFKNVIMVTSSVSSEGKSLTALNLAISLAQEFDHTVLLIDADLRKPSLHGYLGMKPTKGLSEYLAGETELGELLVKTGIGRLTLLPAGRQVKNPVEFFSSQMMKEFIREIKNRYPDRFIIIDTPPVLPFAETRSLGAIVDGVVYVVREGQATPESIAEGIKSFDSRKLIGAVYNDATIANLNGHYHYYYYGYGYGGGNDSHSRKDVESASKTGETGGVSSSVGRLKALFSRGKRKSGEAEKRESV